MLALIADLAVRVVLALLPEVIEAVRAGGDDAAVRRRLAIKLKRRALEQAYELARKELGK